MFKTTLHVLIVEDNYELAATTIEHFELEGIICEHAANGVSALTFTSRKRYDVIILDINIPKISGLEVCKKLRDNGCDTPILMLSALDSLNDKITGFKHGADDYLTKPFNFEELLIRVKALSRRRSGEISIFQLRDLTINYKERSVTRNNNPITLSPINYKILEILSRSSPSPVSKEEITQKIWGEDEPESNSLKVHIFKLRRAINHENPDKLVKTIKNYGFILD